MKSISMPDRVYQSGGVRIWDCASNGPLLRSERDATDLIGAAASLDPEWIVVAIIRLDPEFFALKTRLAGDFLQKFVSYGEAHRNPGRDSLGAPGQPRSPRFHWGVQSPPPDLVRE
jgi:hypothetical protein